MNINSPTFKLFKSEPSFSRGMASIFDLRSVSSKYNVSKNEDNADKIAIQADWRAVGCDLAKSIQEYEQEKE